MKWFEQNGFLFLSFLCLGGVIWGVAGDTGDPLTLQFQKDRTVSSKEISALESVYKKSNTLPAHQMRCFPTTKFVCDRRNCRKSKPVTFILAHGYPTPTYSRCDSSGCDTYPAALINSGEYIVMQPIEGKGGAGFFLKVHYTASDKPFLDIATLELRSHMIYGYCVGNLTAQNDPRNRKALGK